MINNKLKSKISSNKTNPTHLIQLSVHPTTKTQSIEADEKQSELPTAATKNQTSSNPSRFQSTRTLYPRRLQNGRKRAPSAWNYMKRGRLWKAHFTTNIINFSKNKLRSSNSSVKWRRCAVLLLLIFQSYEIKSKFDQFLTQFIEDGTFSETFNKLKSVHQLITDLHVKITMSCLEINLKTSESLRMVPESGDKINTFKAEVEALKSSSAKLTSHIKIFAEPTLCAYARPDSYTLLPLFGTHEICIYIFFSKFLNYIVIFFYRRFFCFITFFF